jgi:phosphopantothenoylcysteine decarboxylase/phosphopantothenate--cysteine ligase
VALPVGPGVTVVAVETSEQLRDAVRAAARHADAVVMAAAVADFRPASAAAAKIKKRPDGAAPRLDLVETPDILAELATERLRPGQVVVGFAAETGDADGDVLDHGRAKARRKGADLLVVNAVGDGLGFGTDENDVVVLDAAGREVCRAAGSKDEVAHAVWDAVAPLLAPAR